VKIIYLHQYFATLQDSAGTRSYEFARRLVAKGHEVHIVTSKRDEASKARSGWLETMEAGAHVHWIPVPYAGKMPYGQRVQAFFRFAWMAAGRAVALGGDVVFATSTPLTIAIPAVYAARRNRIPMVFEVRDLWPAVPIAIGALKGRPLITAARWLERFAYDHAAQIVALSPDMKTAIVHMGYAEHKVHVIPNAADVDLFDVPQEVGTQFRQQHPWLGNRPMILYAGALGLINGVDYLARVAAEMLRFAPEICFVIMGDGREEDQVRRIARELGVLGKNFYMLPSVPKAQMPAVLSACNLATSVIINVPEEWSNSANKFFDGLAAGKPVAINHEGWQAQVLRESGAGLVLPPTDHARAALELSTFLRDAERVQVASLAARRLARERYHRDLLTQQLESVLREATDVR
jgi:glycosyltransferase involved in cell wall biosynthesis